MCNCMTERIILSSHIISHLFHSFLLITCLRNRMEICSSVINIRLQMHQIIFQVEKDGI